MENIPPFATNTFTAAASGHGQANSFGNFRADTVYFGGLGPANSYASAMSSPSDVAREIGEYDRKILQSLSFSGMLDRRANLTPRHARTCEWILQVEDYQKWVSSPRGLLWIKGKPGAGKSTLMAFLHTNINEFRNEDEIYLEFFFNARGAELQRTFGGMLQSLLNQLYIREPSVRPGIRKAYESKAQSFGCVEGSWTWQEQELALLFQENLLVAAQHRPLILIVDALDETGEQAARNIAVYLHKISDQYSQIDAKLKICISCRHFPHVTQKSHNFEVIVEKHNQNDIASFVNDSLDPDRFTDQSSDQRALKDLRIELIAEAQGVFRWVRLMTSLVERGIDEGKSPQQITNALRNVPSELKDLYTYIFRNVIKREDYAESFLLFSWVCLAERPLTVEEMRHAIGATAINNMMGSMSNQEAETFIDSDERMKRRIKSLSGGLLEVMKSEDDNFEYVQVGHQSVSEFMSKEGLILSLSLAKGISQDDSFTLKCKCHAMLYWSCLDYLNSWESRHTYREVQEWGGWEDPAEAYLRYPPNVRVRMLQQRLPFLTYASSCLFYHAEQAGKYRVEDRQSDLSSLRQVMPTLAGLREELQRCTFMYGESGQPLIVESSAANMTDIVEQLLKDRRGNELKDHLVETALHLAATRGHCEVAAILVKAGVNINSEDARGETALVRAVSGGHINMVEWLLDHGAIPDHISLKTGCKTALSVAAAGNHIELVEILLKAGADVNGPSGDGYGNVLQAASARRNKQVIRKLLSAGANVNAQGQEYGSALDVAVASEDVETVRILLNAGADLKAPRGTSLYSPIIWAAGAYGTPSTDRVARAGVKTWRKAYSNPLRMAVSRDLRQIVQILLDAGAKVNAWKDDVGAALELAAEYGHYEIVQMILKAGFDAQALVSNVEKSLYFASTKDHKQIVRLLLHSADVNTKAEQVESALYMAASWGHTEIVQMLVDAGAGSDAQKRDSALRTASREGFDKVVEILIEAGVDFNALHSALHTACVWSRDTVVQVLLAAGANVNARGGEYGNALHAASFNGCEQIVPLLLKAGADVNARGWKNLTATQQAQVESHWKIAKVLVAAGAKEAFTEEEILEFNLSERGEQRRRRPRAFHAKVLPLGHSCEQAFERSRNKKIRSV